jgi:hypothetical protein
MKTLVVMNEKGGVRKTNLDAHAGGVSKPGGRLLAHLWLVGTGSVVFTLLRFAFACSGTVRYVTPAPVVRHQPAPGF